MFPHLLVWRAKFGEHDLFCRIWRISPLTAWKLGDHDCHPWRTWRIDLCPPLLGEHDPLENLENMTPPAASRNHGTHVRQLPCRVKPPILPSQQDASCFWWWHLPQKPLHCVKQALLPEMRESPRLTPPPAWFDAYHVWEGALTQGSFLKRLHRSPGGQCWAFCLCVHVGGVLGGDQVMWTVSVLLIGFLLFLFHAIHSASTLQQ